MATLTIRNVPTSVVRALKQRAEHHHRSMEQEVREILFAETADRESVLARIRTERSKLQKPVSAEMIDGWIAQSRGR